MAGALAGGDRGGVGGIGLVAGRPAPVPAPERPAAPLAARGVATPLAGAARAPEAAALRRVERLAHLLDSAVRVPGTRWRFGLDQVAGLLPGAGDTVTALIGLYVLVEARRLGVPNGVLLRMLGNVGLDWAVGSVPVLGDLFDFAFKAHRRNFELLRRHAAAGAEGRR